jgi:hypothetical protein
VEARGARAKGGIIRVFSLEIQHFHAGSPVPTNVRAAKMVDLGQAPVYTREFSIFHLPIVDVCVAVPG